MINTEQYFFLKRFTNGSISTDSISNQELPLLNDLAQQNLICIADYVEHEIYFTCTKYQITQQGKTAIEEFERTLETTRIAKEANASAKKSNIIAWIAVFISIVAIVCGFFD